MFRSKTESQLAYQKIKRFHIGGTNRNGDENLLRNVLFRKIDDDLKPIVTNATRNLEAAQCFLSASAQSEIFTQHVIRTFLGDLVQKLADDARLVILTGMSPVAADVQICKDYMVQVHTFIIP